MKKLRSYFRKQSVGILSLSFFLAIQLNFSNRSQAQLTWDLLDLSTTDDIMDICFVTNQKGWAVGNNNVLLYTANGGLTWTNQNTGFVDDFTEVFFINASQGAVIGVTGEIYITLNGGALWTSAGYSGIPILESIYFVDQLTGWACGSDGTYGKLYQTTNGGANWSEVTSIGTPGPFYKIDFTSLTNGWVVGESGIYHTSDGNSWSPQSIPTTEFINSISMVDANKGWAVGDYGTILHTTDGGNVWLFQSCPSSQDILDVEFIDFTNGIAVGLYGTVVYTSDGGTNWIDNGGFSTLQNFYAVDMVGGDISFICGSDGNLYKTPSAENDLVIFEYLGFDTLCANVSSPVGVTILNNGPGIIESAQIGILHGSDIILEYSWNGSLSAGQYENVNLGNVSVDMPGIYTGAISGDTVISNNLFPHVIHIVPKPGDTNGPHNICPGDSVEIEATGGTNYNWIDFSPDSTSSIQTVRPLFSQNYLVQINAEFCTTIETVVVTIDPCTQPISAFSPNSDGVNDILIIDGIADLENTVKIYDRWGDIINSYTNYNNSTTVWDGSDNNGEQLGSGTYFYTYEAPTAGISGSSWVQIVVSY